jgi:hypothetical protein
MLAGLAILVGLLCPPATVLETAASRANARDPLRRLDDFDAYMRKILKDWNLPGIGSSCSASASTTTS